MTLEEICKKYDCESAKYITDWNGCRIFELIQKVFCFDGLPLFVVATGRNHRLTTEEETLAIVKTLGDWGE